MKKYVVVLILATIIILAIFYLIKNKKASIQNQTSQTQQISSIIPNPNQFESQNYSTLSSSIPPTSIDYKAIAEEELKRTELQKATTGDLPPVYAQLIGNCKKTIDEILKDYGNVWGPAKPTKNKKGQIWATFSFSKEENDNFMNIFLKYARCEGIVNRNKEKCYSLIRSILSEKSKNVCDSSFSDIMFLAYAYNKKGAKYEFCSEFFSKLNSPSTPKIVKEKFKGAKEETFCEMAKKGVENLCPSFVKAGLIKPEDSEWCYKIFPAKPEHCSSNNEFCTKSIAVSRNDIAYCHGQDDCEFLIKGNCEDIKSQVILTYCSYYNNVEMRRREEEAKQYAEEIRQKEEEAKKIMKIPLKGGKNAETEQTEQ